MVLYSLFGCDSKENYDQYFFNTLMSSNTTPDYFVDWDKVFKDIKGFENSIKLLNSLSNDSNPEEKFKSILDENSEIIPLLNKLVAFRGLSVDIYNEEIKEYKTIEFNNDSNVDDLANFFKETGFLNQLSNIKDIYSYMIGVEVGLNSHARKNRGGSFFESSIIKIIEDKIKDNPSLSFKRGVKYQLDNKTFNNVVYKDDEPKFIIKTNFYNGSGGKVKDVIYSAIDSQKELFNKGLIFIWVTDGFGWKKMKSLYNMASEDLHVMVNSKIFINNFDKIFLLDYY